MRPLTTNLDDLAARPYFLWDEDISVAELRRALSEGSDYERERLMGKMLREARDPDVWRFTTPEEVARLFPRLRRRLGRREAFWRFLLAGWRRDGLLS